MEQRISGTVLRGAAAAYWGGYTGYFADPDGHAGEVAFNPAWKFDTKGNVLIPK